MKVFKIRDANGLYSTGGMEPDFTKGGKVWNSIGHVKNHLRQFLSGCTLEIYANAEIVCIEYTEKETERYDILNYIAALNAQDLADTQSEYSKLSLAKTRDKIRAMQDNRDKL